MPVQLCVEGGSRDQRAAIAHALGALGHEVIAGGDLRVIIVPPLSPSPFVQLDRAAGVALIAGRQIRLTRIELALLGCLIDASGPLDRPALIARIWGLWFRSGHEHRRGAYVAAARQAGEGVGD